MRSADHLDIDLTRHPSASAARPCSLQRVPTFTAVYRADTLSPFPPSACTQVPVIIWGVHLLRVPPRLCVPYSPSPSSPLNLGIVRSLVFLSGGFLRKGEMPGRLHSLVVARPGPSSSRYLAMPAPFRLPPPPHCCSDPIPVGKRSVGCSARSRRKGRLYQ